MNLLQMNQHASDTSLANKIAGYELDKELMRLVNSYNEENDKSKKVHAKEAPSLRDAQPIGSSRQSPVKTDKFNVNNKSVDKTKQLRPADGAEQAAVSD